MGLLSNHTSAGSVPGLSAFNEGGEEGLHNAQSLIKMNEQGYDRHRLIQARDTIGQAWASGDPAKLDAAMRMFPEYIPQMQKQMGIRDDRHRLDVGSMTAKLHGLLSAGDTDGAKALVHQNANLFDKEGPYSAQGVAGMIDSGDDKTLQRLDSWAQSTTMGTLTPLEIIKEGDVQQRFGLDQQRINNQLQLGQERNQLGWANYGERQHWHNGMLELRQQGLLNTMSGDAMTDANGNPLSAYDYNRKILQTGVDPHTNKRATGPQLSAAQKWMKGNQEFTSAQETLHQQIGKLNNLLTDDNLEAGTGRMNGRLPEFSLSDEGQSNRDLINSIKSGEFTTNVQKLKGMGALSNAEGAKLMDLTARIDPAQSTDVVRKQLTEVRDQYQKLIDANYQDAADMGYGQSVLKAYQGPGGDVSELSDDDLLKGL